LYTEHSNKRGGATEAANQGMNDDEIQEVGQWTNLATAKKYIDRNTPMRQKKVLKLQRSL